MLSACGVILCVSVCETVCGNVHRCLCLCVYIILY